MSNYQSKAKGKIEDNIFTSSGLLTLYPHVSDKKYAGIVLNDVEEIEIGDAADPNTFSHSLFGINSTNSSLNLFNNSFEDIWDNSTSPTQGTAVHVVSDFDQNDRVLKVGNGTPTKGNTFLRSLNGIFTDGEMNIDIKKNIFGSSSSDVDRLRVHGIGIRNPGYKSVVIENGNEFYDYNYGVWTENDRNYNVLYIHNNDFFNHFDYSEFLGGNTAYYGSAITALSYIPITVSNAEISLNTIGSSDPNDFEQSRIGIRVANLKRFRILANHIFFNHAAVPGNVFTGITLQNCKDARLNLNEVVNVNTLFPSGSKNTLVGLRIHDSNNTCIENSTLSGLGFSMMFHGNSVVNSLYTNTMTNFDTSICLVTANIGATQGSSTNVLNNRWFRNNMNNNTTGRVAGSTHNGGQIVWYHQGIVNSSDEFIPYSAGGIVTSFQISNYSTLSSCPANFVFGEQDDPPYTATTRNSNYGYIVGDSGRFDEEYFHEYRYLSRGELYLTLKNNPELLSMDDTADDSFVGFYADMSGSNYQHFDSVFALIESGDLLTAESIVLAIDDTNDIEYNMKTVLQILLHSLIVDSAFSASDSTLLIEIAYRNPLTGGNGVFIARHLLNLEIYDEEESGSRIASFNQKKNEKKFIEVYPVPSKVGVYIKPTGDFIPDGLELFGINGELVYKATFKNYLNIDFLKAGIYLVRVFSGNEFRHAKIVKLP
ncbi:MAG: T9SS type A sorting domain-containing protein [Bacteroidetes bacterium]|nr:T9SS type A sorting domain-containing protein [Bacteroidota bacterium]